MKIYLCNINIKPNNTGFRVTGYTQTDQAHLPRKMWIYDVKPETTISEVFNWAKSNALRDMKQT